jgi:hypothetical protein
MMLSASAGPRWLSVISAPQRKTEGVPSRFEKPRALKLPSEEEAYTTIPHRRESHHVLRCNANTKREQVFDDPDVWHPHGAHSPRKKRVQRQR